MKTIFRLYNNHQSSIFDMIDGDDEVKQTKGLAFIFNKFPDFLFSFLRQDEISRFTDVRRFSKSFIQNISAIEVSAEKITNSNARADIVVKIDKSNKPFQAVVIEAKSIRRNVTGASRNTELEKQVEGYLDESEFPDLVGYKKTAVVLTRNIEFFEGVASITWGKIIDALYEFQKGRKDTELLKQYFNFLTGVDTKMKFYEEEVLSLPAGESIELIENHHIYVCPDNRSYKRTLFVTFRNRGGGEMERLYKIDDIVVLNPAIESEVERLNSSDIPTDTKNNILAYVEDERRKGEEFNFDARFHILSSTGNIELKNKPKPKINNANHAYYNLSELFNKRIVEPSSVVEKRRREK